MTKPPHSDADDSPCGVDRNELLAVGSALAGATLLGVPARLYRIDAFATAADRCRAWPSLAPASSAAALYLVAIALLTIGWLTLLRLRRLPLGRCFAWAALVHALVLARPPFLSLDSLFYAALGRNHGAAPLPIDPLWAALPPALRIGSTYGAGFDLLARALCAAAGNDVTTELRLFQLVAVVALFAAALLTARSVAPRDAGRTAAVVLFCPLALVEATANAHNDALLAASVALAVWCVARDARRGAIAALALGMAIKSSALLLLAIHVVASTRRLVAARPQAARRLAIGLLALILVGGVIGSRLGLHASGELASLLGSPTQPIEHCTRSLECLPRAALHWGLHRVRLAWLLGLAFRVLAALWLGYAGWRAGAPEQLLRWSAFGLFGYYLAFHAYLQSWYLLSLLPLLPHAAPAVRRAMRVFAVAAVAYYALRLPLGCDERIWLVGVRELAEGLIVIGPALTTLARRYRDG